MAETPARVGNAGLALGAVSLVGQLSAACITGLDIRARSKYFGPDLLTFKARFDILAARVKAWSSGWRIPEQKHLKSARFVQYGTIAAKILLVIYTLIESLDTLKTKFPCLDGRYAMNSVDLAAAVNHLALLEDPNSTSRQLQKSVRINPNRVSHD
jgi:hypothetical protein